ncbi:helix-turn-helix transcriptional regulator [Pseudomonas sp. C9-3]|uniref:helix-turn-helix domain-containing protein n=1 Tax=Pseudomonas sp. C9-3 TaxID=3078264 RepID=UPI0028EE6F0E|nr:helix-turn-helix transcriptional regulator [Pseudomonas sp. C9-3]
MMKAFRKLIQDIKSTHEYRVERAKLEFVRSLSRLMKRKGVNSAELAEKVGTSSAYISKALRGDTNFTIDSMVKLSHAIGGQLHIHIAEPSASVQWFEVFANTSMHAKSEPLESVAVLEALQDSESYIDVSEFYRECQNEERRIFA